jgi:hypothetical protein
VCVGGGEQNMPRVKETCQSTLRFSPHGTHIESVSKPSMQPAAALPYSPLAVQQVPTDSRGSFAENHSTNMMPLQGKVTAAAASPLHGRSFFCAVGTYSWHLKQHSPALSTLCSTPHTSASPQKLQQRAKQAVSR